MDDSPKNKTTASTAVAVHYDSKSNCAPNVSAIGQNQIAELMINTARRHNIPVKYDQKLTQKLSELEEQESIPQQFYDDVARIFCELDEPCS